MNFFFRWPWTFTNDLRTKSWNTLRSQAILVWSKNLQCFSIREISWNEKGFDNLKDLYVLQNIFNKLQIRQILLALEENSYGIIRYMCVLNCEFDQLCIWFQLCKVTESLFYCKTCCKWKKKNKGWAGM